MSRRLCLDATLVRASQLGASRAGPPQLIKSEQLRVLILLTPAGMEGWFKEFSVPARAITLPPAAEIPHSDVERMLEVSPQYGIEFVLPKMQ